MAKLSDVAVKDVARMAGFTGDGLAIAIAIALAESGGDPNAIHHNSDKNQTTDRGLWQINNYWHKEVSDSIAFDPTQAAAAVFAISKGGTNWKAWATYSNGHYLMYMPRAKAALGKDAANGPTTPSGTYDEYGNPVDTTNGYKNPDTTRPDIQNVGGGLTGWLDGLGKLLSWITNVDNWRRIGLVAAGLAAMFASVVIIKRGDIEQVAKLAAVA